MRGGQFDFVCSSARTMRPHVGPQWSVRVDGLTKSRKLPVPLEFHCVALHYATALYVPRRVAQRQERLVAMVTT